MDRLRSGSIGHWLGKNPQRLRSYRVSGCGSKFVRESVFFCIFWPWNQLVTGLFDPCLDASAHTSCIFVALDSALPDFLIALSHNLRHHIGHHKCRMRSGRRMRTSKQALWYRSPLMLGSPVFERFAKGLNAPIWLDVCDVYIYNTYFWADAHRRLRRATRPSISSQCGRQSYWMRTCFRNIFLRFFGTYLLE